MSEKRSDIILSESTIVILESANAVLEHVTCGSAKKFHYATLRFSGHDGREIQLVTVHGLAKTSFYGRLFEVEIILMLDKSDEGYWRLSPLCIPMVTHNYLEIAFKVSDKGGFTCYSSSDEEHHEEIKRRWQFGT